MSRLTTDNPNSNLSALLNYAYAKDGEVYLRYADDEENVSLAEYVSKIANEEGCTGIEKNDVLNGYECNIFEPFSCNCKVGILNAVAIQAAELRSRLKHYEDLEEQGRLVILPFGDNAELLRDGMVFKGSHWNHVLTAFADDPEAYKGKRLGLFGIEDAEAALNGGAE